jgi:hypothetical protein
MRLISYVAVGCCGSMLLLASGAQALTVPIPDLFSTGVDANGQVLGNDQPELHYFFAGPSAVPRVPDANGNPVPISSLKIRTFTQPNPGTYTSWSGNSSTSTWIGADNPTVPDEPTGSYEYTTNFTLTPDLDPSTASITAYVFGDDGIPDVFFNGIDTGLQNFVPGTQLSPFQVPYQFDFTSGFQPGLNTIVWDITNTGGPSGLRVQIISSVEQNGFNSGGGPPGDLPEPSSVALALVGIAALAWTRWGGLRRLSLPART